MPTDRAQDTEAIRAALDDAQSLREVLEDERCECRDEHLAALARLVARLEAAERERDEEHRRESQRMNAIPAFRRGYQVGQEELIEAHAAELGWDGATTALERAREQEQRIADELTALLEAAEGAPVTGNALDDACQSAWELLRARAALAAAAPGETEQTP